MRQRGWVIGWVAMLVGVGLWNWFIYWLCRPGLSALTSILVAIGFTGIVTFFMAWISLPGAGCQKVVIVNRDNKNER